MDRRMQKLEELLSGIRYAFRTGFPDRVMNRILESEMMAGDYLSARISRLFYWVNVPGLAAAIAILVLLILAGNLGDAGSGARYTSAFSEILNDFYDQLIN